MSDEQLNRPGLRGLDQAAPSEEEASLDQTPGLVDQPACGTQQNVADELTAFEPLSAKGQNGQITVTDDSMTIERKRGIARMEKIRCIPLSSIAAVQLHSARVTAGLLNTPGFLRVTVKGSPQGSGGLTDALHDENSVVFAPKQAREFSAIHAYVETYLADHPRPANKSDYTDPIDDEERRMPEEPVMRFKSHIEGKNAQVEIWPDRIEWTQNRGAGAARTTARWTAAVSTGGLSLLKTGLGGRTRDPI